VKKRIPKRRNPYVEDMRQKLKPQVIPNKTKIVYRKRKHRNEDIQRNKPSGEAL